jgi:hypothetical protein
MLNTLDAVNEFEDERGFIVQDFAIVKLLGKLGMQVRPAGGGAERYRKASNIRYGPLGQW